MTQQRFQDGHKLQFKALIDFLVSAHVLLGEHGDLFMTSETHICGLYAKPIVHFLQFDSIPGCATQFRLC